MTSQPEAATERSSNPPATGADELLSRFGPARHPERPPAHRRPEGIDDATVTALGRLGEALEAAEDARGHLYAFHRLSGHADLALQDALGELRDAGHGPLADRIADVLVGRDVVRGLWTFQIVEDYDANYLAVFRAAEEAARAEFDAPPHLHEAEMKHREQSGPVST